MVKRDLIEQRSERLAITWKEVAPELNPSITLVDEMAGRSTADTFQRRWLSPLPSRPFRFGLDIAIPAID